MNELLQQNEYNTLVTQHEIWLQSDGQEGRRANFRAADLTQIQLGTANLRNANMRGVKLMGSDMRGLALDDTDLAESDLRYTNMTAITCHRTNFSRANLSHAYLNEASCIGANFQQAVCVALDARNTQMTGVILRDVDLSKANFSFSQLSGASLRNALAEDTILTHSDLSQADCHTAKFIGTTFVETILHDTNMRKASFVDVSFGDADFAACQNLDASLFTQSASQTKRSLKSEIDTLQEMRGTMDAERKALESDKASLMKARQRLQSLWREEADYNELLAKQSKRIRRSASVFIILCVLIVVSGGYWGALQGLHSLWNAQSSAIIALWSLLSLLCVVAGIQLYQLSSATVRHLQDKARLLENVGANPVSEVGSEEADEENAKENAQITELPMANEEGKIEYF